MTKQSPIAIRNRQSKCSRYMEGKLVLLPGEVSWTWRNEIWITVETRFIM